MKGFITILLLMIPALGYLILRSDPIVYSNNVQKNETTVKQVQAFAAFIESKPELTRHPSERPSAKVVESNEAKAEARELVNEVSDIWRQNPPKYDQMWRNQVEKLFDIAEQTGSEEALDLIQTQILAGRIHSDDLNREKADKWVERYLKIEKRESKVREMSDDFKEKVLDRIDQDERKLREEKH